MYSIILVDVYIFESKVSDKLCSNLMHPLLCDKSLVLCGYKASCLKFITLRFNRLIIT